MGVNFGVKYRYGFTWTFPKRFNNKTIEDIIKFLYKIDDKMNSKKYYYICAQYDKYFKSRKIVVGVEDKRVENKYLCACIQKIDIEEKFEEDGYLRKSPFLNFLHDYVECRVNDPQCGFCKEDFRDNPFELAEKSWEITERNDITSVPERNIHHSAIQKIYNFLQNINNEYAEGRDINNAADIEDIWCGSEVTISNPDGIFKWYAVTYVGY